MNIYTSETEFLKAEIQRMEKSLECMCGICKLQQRTWVGLTDEEALDCWPGLAMYADCVKFWENIEAKLKEKNEH